MSEICIEHQARPTRRAADAPPARRYPPIWYCTVHICFRNLVSTVYIPCNRFANASAFAHRRRTIPLRASHPIRSLSSPTRARRPILTVPSRSRSFSSRVCVQKYQGRRDLYSAWSINISIWFKTSDIGHQTTLFPAFSIADDEYGWNSLLLTSRSVDCIFYHIMSRVCGHAPEKLTIDGSCTAAWSAL